MTNIKEYHFDNYEEAMELARTLAKANRQSSVCVRLDEDGEHYKCVYQDLSSVFTHAS